MRGKNGEPWRLTSQPRPQGGHPRAGETRLNELHSNITKQELSCIQHFTSHSQFPTKACTKIHLLNQIEGWRWAFTMRRSQLWSDALSRLIINALSRHTMSIPSTYLLMPPIMQSQDNHVSQFTTSSSPHMEEFSQLQWQAQLTPSPQGFSSLPRVSEAFTPNTTINPQQQLKKIKPNANRFNMLTHNTKINKICQMQPHRFLQAHYYTSIFNFHDMR